jgi:hypothetical protein
MKNPFMKWYICISITVLIGLTLGILSIVGKTKMNAFLLDAAADQTKLTPENYDTWV